MDIRMPARKITLMAADLPALPEQQLAIFCRQCEDMLADRLAKSQLGHLRAFPLRGEALKARTSRALARLLALGAMPTGSLIGMDKANRPTVVGDDRICLAFSHCEGKAFAAFAKKRNAGEIFRMAIDAEACSDKPNVEAMRNFLARIGPASLYDDWNHSLDSEDIICLWLLYECAIKLSAKDIDKFFLSARACGEFPRKGSFLHESMTINWRIALFSGSLICVASTGDGLPEIESILYKPAAGASAHA